MSCSTHTRYGQALAVVLILAATAVEAQPPGGAAPGDGQMPTGGLPPTAEAELAHKHDGYFGALAPQNLAKHRPKAPFNMTGTWFVDLRRSFADFMFGPPYPEFYAAGQQAMREAAQAMKAHQSYRDSIGQCFPAGMPMIMTRVWPTNIIQLPTSIHMIFGFTNSYRVIYTDGRPHTDPDIAISTYNGESIGHWEGDTLVVDTRYFEPNQHYIDMGLPISDQFQLTEKIRMLDKGTTLQIEYIMVDPKSWKGEWHNTKRFLRMDYSDVPEVECLPNLNENLPSTEKGHAAVEQREQETKKAAEAPPPSK